MRAAVSTSSTAERRCPAARGFGTRGRGSRPEPPQILPVDHLGETHDGVEWSPQLMDQLAKSVGSERAAEEARVPRLRAGIRLVRGGTPGAAAKAEKCPAWGRRMALPTGAIGRKRRRSGNGKGRVPERLAAPECSGRLGKHPEHHGTGDVLPDERGAGRAFHPKDEALRICLPAEALRRGHFRLLRLPIGVDSVDQLANLSFPGAACLSSEPTLAAPPAYSEATRLMRPGRSRKRQSSSVTFWDAGLTAA
jgi:hypothetical protein